MQKIKKRIVRLLRWSQKYTRVDMLYVVRGSFWLTGTKGALALISLLTMIAFANLVPEEVYGTYQFVISVAALAGICALPGMRSAFVRAVAKGREFIFLPAFKAKFRWSLVGSAALFAVSGWYFFHDDTLLAAAFAVTALFLPLESTLRFHNTYWHGAKRFNVFAVLKVLAASGSALVVITTLFLTDSVLIILTAFFASHALFEGILFLYTKRHVRKQKEEESDTETITYGKHLTLIQSVGVIASHIDSVIIWKFLGPVEVAIYSFARLPIKKAQGVVPIQALALPKLSENGIAHRKSDVAYKLMLMFGMTIPAAGALYVLAPFIYPLIFPQYTEAVQYFQALTVLIALMPFSFLGSGFLAEKRTSFLYINGITIPVFKIALFLILTPLYGLWGMVIALIVAEVTRNIIQLTYFITMKPLPERLGQDPVTEEED